MSQWNNIKIIRVIYVGLKIIIFNNILIFETVTGHANGLNNTRPNLSFQW